MPIPENGLRPGDVIIHHDDNWWDGVMSWGEWDGAAHEDYGATHVDVFLGGIYVAKMNPKVSCLYSINDIPWKQCYVLRLKPIQVGSQLEYPSLDNGYAKCLWNEVHAHLGEPYDWSQIERFTGIGLLARLDPSAARAELLKADPLNVLKGHCGVCSEWTEARIENALHAAYGITVDLAAGSSAGQDGARPSDWPSFPMFEQVSSAPFLNPLKPG